VIGKFSTPYEASKSIIACFIAFWFGLFLGYYTTYFYYGEEMAMKADMLGAIGTWVASAATLFTLFFLIIQNNKTQKRQEQLEERQNELWEAQQVKINFEMYQAHKREFFNVLDDIEKSSPMDIEFYDREGLYRRIFPMNSFYNVKFEVKIGDTLKFDNGNFTNINKAYTSSIELLNALVYDPAYIGNNDIRPIQFIHSLQELASNLQLFIKPNGGFGDVTSEDGMLINAYKLDKTINEFHNAFKNISVFTGNPDVKSVFNLNIQTYMDAMQKAIFTRLSEPNMFNLNLDKNRYALGLYEFYKFFEHQDVRIADMRIADNDGFHSELHEYMINPEKIEALVHDRTTLTNKINCICERFNKISDHLKIERVDEFRSIYNIFNMLFITQYCFDNNPISFA